MDTKLRQIAVQFAESPNSLTITPLGNGLINETYLIEGPSHSFVLQRINCNVFPEPYLVMENISMLGQHIRQKAASSVHLKFPSVLLTREGQSSYQDENRRFWRALERIYPAESRCHISHPEEFAQVGFALAHFHRLCADLPSSVMHDTLPGFHVTPNYLAQYHQLLERPITVTLDDDLQKCRSFIEARQNDAGILESAKAQGKLADRLIHGDPKLNNFLFEPGTHRIVSLIDLDTVKPGLVHYDIADCLRSCCHDKQNNRFEFERCQVILQSYLQEAGDFFSASDYDYLYAAIWLIPFELGLRFFSDYLNGNRYFKVSAPRQNLNRALAQFALCESIERQRPSLEDFISKLKSSRKANALP